MVIETFLGLPTEPVMLEACWLPPAGAPMSAWPYPVRITESLVCGVCGIMTPSEGAGHRPVRVWDRQGYPPGRLCRVCAAADRLSQPVAVVDGLVDPADPAATEVFQALTFFADLDPLRTHPWMPGYAKRWAWVDEGMVAGVVARVHERFAPHPNSAGYGCAGCGVAAASAWAGCVLTTLSKPRELCPDCLRVLERCGGMGPRFADALAAAAAGLTAVPFTGFAGQLRFAPYAIARPDGAGSALPFAWLAGDLERLQRHAAQEWPELVAGADVAALRESRRLAALEAVAAAAQGLALGGAL